MSNADDSAALDVLGSEWGRLYERQGHECRILARNSGRLAGGHVLVGLPSNAHGNVDFELSFLAQSIEKRENLSVQVRNLQTDYAGTLETLRHCRLAMRHGVAEGFLLGTNDAPVERHQLLALRVMRAGEEYWAKWGCVTRAELARLSDRAGSASRQ
jgi:hypothetical protein